jgi:MFS family permease
MLVFTIVAIALLMTSVDATIVAAALHALQHSTYVDQLGRMDTTVYLFGRVSMLPISGKLSEQYGRRRVFLGSVPVFTAASLCCGLAEIFTFSSRYARAAACRLGSAATSI